MSGAGPHDETVRHVADGEGAAASRDGLVLLVLDGGHVTQHRASPGATLVIGRGEECAIVLGDARASRKHAAVMVDEHGAATLEDLGSANGTVVDGRRLAARERALLKVGATVEVGSTRILLAPPPTTAPAVRVVSHSVFLARLHEREISARRGPFGVLRIRFPAASLATVEEVVAQAFAGGALVGAYAEGELEAFVDPLSPEAASKLATSLRASLAALRVKAVVGVATSPADATSVEKLLARAAPVREQPADGPAATGFFARVRPTLERVAKSALNVLVIGETGVGKEVAARTIHTLSNRSAGPLVTINCAAVAESLLESELFGYERGAFTGAVAPKAGLLETANGGTVFLDELGEMPLGLQAKLLRVIEQREVQRVGALKSRPLDVRFVAATNRDLGDAIARGTFRQDLLFRLNGYTLEIPRLAERRDEIEPLARAFIDEAARTQGLPAPSLEEDALAVLLAHEWPGNVRELKNAIERAVVLCEGGRITFEDFPHLPTARPSGSGSLRPPAATPSRPTSPTLLPDMDETAKSPPSSFTLPRAGKLAPEEERAIIVAVLEQCAGNQTHAARLLNVSRRTLISRLDAYDIRRPRKP